MSELFKCKYCKPDLPKSAFKPAKTRRGFRMSCIQCEEERTAAKDARRLAARRAKAVQEKENKRVELAQVIKQNRMPEMISIMPAGSDWAKWWQPLVDAESSV